MPRDLVLYPDPLLLEKCEPVTEFDGELLKLILEMVTVMERENGVGLAASQIGVLKQLFVYKGLGGEPKVAINPELLAHSYKTVAGTEGCLSIPDREFQVQRPLSVQISARGERGQELIIYGNGVRARVLMHELDHLSGTLLFDRGDEINGS